jgi:glycosyltransferase involved in cell wall biosynthesis
MRISVLIPTYNEAREIARLINEIKSHNLDVLVVDDGSQDNTSQIATDCGARVLRNPNNSGKGASLTKGFRYCLDQNYDAVITMDGDGQHLPEDLPSFIALAQKPENQILIGNRMQRTRAMPWVRIATNKFMSWMLSVLTKQKIPDSQCGFRLIKREALERMSLITSKYEIESEMLIKGARLGYRIESVPIRTVYLNEKSRINPFVDTLRFVRLVFKELWSTPR